MHYALALLFNSATIGSITYTHSELDRLFTYPTGTKFSVEFKFRYFANGNFAKVKSRLLLCFLEISQ